ncbi:MAG: hypothetical protein Q8P50_06870 [Bacillota bacterium]|nr:hypothetical protein [Bacillota bacterium]
MPSEYFTIISHQGSSDEVFLNIWSKSRRIMYQVNLSSPRSVLPVLALEAGAPLAWAEARGIKLPQAITHESRGKHLLPRPPGMVENILASSVLRAFQDLAERSAPHESLQVLRDGVHVIDDLMVWVNGTEAWIQERGGEWVQVDGPVKGSMLLHGTARWTDLKPTDPSPYGPAEVLQILLDILGTGWVWTHRADMHLIGLSLMKASIADAFERQEYLWITGSRGCGKSRLAKGLASGEAFFPRLLDAAHYVTNATQAGLTGKFAGRTPLLLLDEFEHTKYRDQVLTLLRSSMDSRAGVLRGTPSLGYREQVLKCPAWICSIESLTLDQDLDRVIRIDLPKVKGRTAPEIAVSKAGIWARVNPEKLRRSLTVALLPHVWTLRDMYHALKTKELPGEREVDYRMKESLLGLLAVASTAGENPEELAGRIFAAKAPVLREQSTLSVEERLIAALMDTTVEIIKRDPFESRDQRRRTTIRGLVLESKDQEDVDHLEDVGFFYSWKENLIYISWPTVVGNILARTTEFRGSYERDLIHIVKRHPSFCDHDQKTVAGHRRRVTLLDAKLLLGGEGHDDQPL